MAGIQLSCALAGDLKGHLAKTLVHPRLRPFDDIVQDREKVVRCSRIASDRFVTASKRAEDAVS